MVENQTESFASLGDALKYLGLASGLHINETDTSPSTKSIWPSVLNLMPLLLGFIGLIFNILALLIFTTSKTFRQSSFRWYIYAFVLVNCASSLSNSWLYLVFYLADTKRVCKYIQYLQQSLSTTSLWILVILSFERSFTFIRPFTVKNLVKSRTVCCILFLVICSCFALHIDDLVSVDVKAFRWVNFAYGLCSMKRRSTLMADRIKLFTHSHAFILPFLLNSIFGIYISYKICQRRRRLLNKTPLIIQCSSKFRRSKISLANEITLTLLWQSMWLLMTYLPTHIYYYFILYGISNDRDHDNSILTFLIRLNLLIYLAFSPTLYVIFSPTLRREIQIHLCRSYKQRRATNSSYASLTSQRLDRFSKHQQRTKSTMLIIRSEELPRKFPPMKKIIPNKCLNKYISKSAPCLLMYTNEYDFDQYTKTERSSTFLQ